MITAHIGIGSNLGDRLAHIQAAIAHLKDIPQSQVTLTSPFYESEAITHGDPQPDFINSVAAIETDLGPAELLHHLHDIEACMGRSLPRAKWQQRMIDLDLLTYGNKVSEDSDMLLPHPEIPKRLFVLLPLRDIAPAWHHPATGHAITDLITRCLKQYSSSCVSIGSGGFSAR